jgi:hypothetical protein
MTDGMASFPGSGSVAMRPGTILWLRVTFRSAQPVGGGRRRSIQEAEMPGRMSAKGRPQPWSSPLDASWKGGAVNRRDQCGGSPRCPYGLLGFRNSHLPFLSGHGREAFGRPGRCPLPAAPHIQRWWGCSGVEMGTLQADKGYSRVTHGLRTVRGT